MNAGGGIVLRLPDGRELLLDRARARELTQQLWEIGVFAGAAPLAAQLTVALRRPEERGSTLDLTPREHGALRRVLDLDAPQ